MFQKVKFVNKSGGRITLYEGSGILKILEPGKRWNRPPEEGTLDTRVVMDTDMKFPPPREKPYWIDKVEWVWDECPEGSIYAPYRTITFLDGNQVKLKRRPRWTAPEMDWPCVEFLFKSHTMKMQTMHLGLSTMATTLYNGIPMRITVDPLSKYAEWKKWIFDEELILKDVDPPFKNMKEVYEATEHGEDKRGTAELEKIAELVKKNEERIKLGMF
ncbi:hypothetical protein KA005_29040 [bacterium]|nr:hypothetical protein [bacterium]